MKRTTIALAAALAMSAAAHAQSPTLAMQKEVVGKIYVSLLADRWTTYLAARQWQQAHPQCKHVGWWKALDGKAKSADDFSGRHDGRPGECTADGDGPARWGSEDNLEAYDPASNPLIARYVCAEALYDVIAYQGIYADPAFCGGNERTP